MRLRRRESEVMTNSVQRLRFAAAVSYRATTPDGLARQKRSLEEAASSGMDAETAFALVEHHRVFAIAIAVLEATGMQAILGNRFEDLRRISNSVRKESLVLSLRGEQARRAIEQAGVRCLDFKGGPNLSRKLYGDLALRHCKDVDLMVRPAALEVAIEALRADGWNLDFSTVWLSTPHHRALSRYILCDFPFTDSRTGCQVELHVRFEQIPNPGLDAIWWEAMSAATNSELSEAEFLFLVFHGTKHLWNRMKWLGDIAAILDDHPSMIERCAPLIGELHMENMFAPLAVLLRDLYDLELPGSTVPDARGRSQAASCILALQRKELSSLTAVEEAIDGLRMSKFRRTLFGPRVSFARRTSYHLFSLFVRFKDIVAMGAIPWALLPFVPLVRVVSVVWRYTGHVLHPVKGGAHR